MFLQWLESLPKESQAVICLLIGGFGAIVIIWIEMSIQEKLKEKKDKDIKI